MEIIISIIRGIISANKMRKRVQQGFDAKFNIMKVIKDSVVAYATTLLLIVLLGGGALYSVTYAVGEAFDWLLNLGKGNSIDEIYDLVGNLTPEELEEFEKTVAFVDPKKLRLYVDKERESVPAAIQGIKTVDTNGNITNENVTLDISHISNQYRLPWQLVGSMDIISFRGKDINDLTVVNAANSIMPKFTWEKDVYRDTTNYWKEWEVDTKVDEKENGGKPVVLKDGESSAKENYKLVKEPLGIAREVDTLFGKYKYNVSRDVVLKDDPYSTPYVTEKVLTKTEWVHDHYEDDLTKPIYEDDKTKPIYEDDLSKPIYGNDYSKPIYGNDYSRPIYGTEGTDHIKISTKSWPFSSTIEMPSDYNLIHMYPGMTFRYILTNSTDAIFGNDEYQVILKIPKGKVNSKDKLKSAKYLRTTKEIIGYEQKIVGYKQKIIGYEKKFVGYEKKIVGYEQKSVKRPVYYYKTSYKKTREKIVEDQVSQPNFAFQPNKFIKFLNDAEYSVEDLPLLQLTLEGLPTNSNLLDMLDRIIEGDYGDITVPGGPNGGGGSPGSGVSPIPIFYQYDARWGNQPYAGETIHIAGCAPTSMAMVVTGLLGNLDGLDLNDDGVFDPSESATWSTNNGYAVHMQGTYDSFINEVSKKAGLDCVQTYKGNDAYEALKQGKVVVANIVPGTISGGLHFIVLTGVTSDGKVTMNDPYSEKNTKTEWDFNTIARESQNLWIIENTQLHYTDAFIMRIRQGAINDYKEFGILPSITIAQGALESSWGRSGLTKKANNLFGIKADPSWNGPSIEMPTSENHNDLIMASFRVYDSWDHSVLDHSLFLVENSRYAEHGFFEAKDYRGQAKALENAGYATDKDENGVPQYANKLCGLIEDFNLQLYDK